MTLLEKAISAKPPPYPVKKSQKPQAALRFTHSSAQRVRRILKTLRHAALQSVGFTDTDGKHCDISALFPRSSGHPKDTIHRVCPFSYLIAIFCVSIVFFALAEEGVILPTGRAVIVNSDVGYDQTVEALRAELHTRYNVPLDLMNRMAAGSWNETQQPFRAMLQLLRRNRPKGHHRPLALIARVSSRSPEARVRAVASAIVYAQTTGRVPVILWDSSDMDGWNDVFVASKELLSNVVLVNDHGLQSYMHREDPKILEAEAGNGAPQSPVDHDEGTDAHAEPLSGDADTENEHVVGVSSLGALREAPEGRESGKEDATGDDARVPDEDDAGAPDRSHQGNHEDDRQRLSADGGDPRTDPDASEAKLDGASRIPLFDWSETSLLHITDVETPASGQPDSDATHMMSPAIESFAKRWDSARDLDSAAAVDAHVMVSIQDEMQSGYAPHSLAVELITSRFLAPTPEYEKAVADAFPFELSVASLSEDTINHRLHVVFEIPIMLLRDMSSRMKTRLLESFLARQALGIHKPRAIFVHTQYGLGNRLRALGSAMAYAKETNRVVVLIWVPDHHLRCRFTDLFMEQDDILVINRFSASPWPFTAELASDTAADSVLWYNYMRQNGTHVHSPIEHIADDPSKHHYVSTAYVIQTPRTPQIIRTQSPYWVVLKTLTPTIPIALLVEQFAQLPMGNMMGVHIRSKTIKSDIKGVGAEEYSKESSSRTDYWRNLTQVGTFIDEMHRQPNSQLFYVAADRADTLYRLEKEFPSRVFYTPRECDGRDRNCLRYALADIILLSRCSTIRGSYWSSFSELSLRLGGGRVLLAGIDFGKPKFKPKAKREVRRVVRRHRIRRKRRKVVKSTRSRRRPVL